MYETAQLLRKDTNNNHNHETLCDRKSHSNTVRKYGNWLGRSLFYVSKTNLVTDLKVKQVY